MFPVGLVIMLNSYTEYLWTTSLFISIQALVTLILLITQYGVSSALLCFGACSFFSFIIEYIGLSSGFPFGKYSYSGILQPMLAGVPIAIVFAWFVLVVNSLLSLGNLHSVKFYITVFLSSVMVMSVDLMLEPFASFINRFWIWENEEIPLQNFISWFISSLILSSIVLLLIRKRIKNTQPKYIRNSSITILTLNILNFVILNLVHCYYELT
ncbi:MAG: carotenoid biosynthesis protein, partial [Ignavibacteria bacterium]|nr:carotenoid biosynthesis protein [Ignavibacteria bacterium]